MDLNRVSAGIEEGLPSGSPVFGKFSDKAVNLADSSLGKRANTSHRGKMIFTFCFWIVGSLETKDRKGADRVSDM